MEYTPQLLLSRATRPCGKGLLPRASAFFRTDDRVYPANLKRYKLLGITFDVTPTVTIYESSQK